MNLKKQFTRLDCDRFRRDCNFTPDELAVFDLCTKAESITEISMQLHISTSTVSRKIKNIKRKINQVIMTKKR